jgi:hypothetical protein
VQVPAPLFSVIVPFVVLPLPQLIVHVCVSVVPGSLNEALTETVLLTANTLPAVGDVTVTTGARFATETVKLPVEVAPVTSVTVTVTVYGVERSFAYLWAAESAPGDPLNVETAEPSPQLTLTL